MNPWRGIGRLPKEVWVLCGTTLINRMGTMALPFLVVYLTKSLGYSAAEAGLVLTIYGAAAFALSAWFGMKLLEAVGASTLWGIAFIMCSVSSLLLLHLREQCS